MFRYKSVNEAFLFTTVVNVGLLKSNFGLSLGVGKLTLDPL